MKGFLKANKNKAGKIISFRIGAPLPKDSNGKPQYRFATVKTDSIGKARKALRELLTSIEQGTYIKPEKTCVSEYLKTWLMDYIKPNLSPRTLELYTYICKKHLVTLGNIPLCELKPQHLQHLYSEKLSSGLSARTVQLIHVTMHKALKNAVKMGLLIRNAAENVDIPKNKRTEMKTMNESDLQIFLESAKTTQYYALFYTCLFTGMRRAELLGLRWKDVDLILCQLSVIRTMQYIDAAVPGKKIIFKEPKTEKSRRLISLTPSNAIVLREHKQQQQNQRESLGLSELTEEDLVFSHFDGSPYLPNSITHAWIKLIRKCGLNGIRLHDARHTHASLLLKQGVHAKVVSERLGHAGIGITLNLYSHVAPGMQQAAANKFDEIALPKESKLDRALNVLLK